MKAQPLDLFDDNLDDAERLLHLNRTLLNARPDRMSDRTRAALAQALDVPSSLGEFTSPRLRVLLRQSVVSIATSVETYVAAKAATFVDEALNGPKLPRRLAEFLEKENVLPGARRTRVEDHIYTTTTASPERIGFVFSLVGRLKVMRRADRHRGVENGQTAKEFSALATRRNDIVHRGDRAPGASRRRSLKPRDVARYLHRAREGVVALDAVLGTPQAGPRPGSA